MRLIRFTQPVKPYNAGEIAGFDDMVALKYVQVGFATWYYPETREVKTPPRDKMVRKASTKKEEKE